MFFECNFSISPGIRVANRHCGLSPEGGGIVKLGASAPSSDPSGNLRQRVAFCRLGAEAPSLTILSRWDFPDSHFDSPPPGLIEELPLNLEF